VKVGNKKDGKNDNKDLVWISECVNVASKLSDYGNSPRNIRITNKIYINLFDDHKYHVSKDSYGYEQKQDMWQYESIDISGKVIDIYSTSYYWKIG
jgi:hypothetical protein